MNHCKNIINELLEALDESVLSLLPRLNGIQISTSSRAKIWRSGSGGIKPEIFGPLILIGPLILYSQKR